MKSTKTRQRLIRGTGVAALAGGLLVAAGPAQAATVIGPINISAQCRAQYGPSSSAIVLDSGNPYSWRCAYSGYQYGVNLDSACINQYGGGAFSIALDVHNAYSWRCAR
ncbi:conserved hypothetical protein [Catenulispora acidiphila DSM 44928]|uniref:Secreted protein n=1 Tax=Catenulispora acidiphila (strain DSM 44928 / JCM 14897 / NBRC 102108 / NRRL B-24433 / ID139908) TaxID=479433 RepID=C7Q3I6_CATAD|nr:hypothetical protein [Catenulispora acidiphila]ACU75751.1 conserved hypothetical protein [Catenulispora acidiphila DSM 44928]